VDVLPVSLLADGRTIARIGLIHRETPHQGRRWCMVGGRLWRNESLVEAATRQIRETLGLAVQFAIAADRQPDHVVQYFTFDRSVGLLDPRQHAVTMVFVVPITGEVVPGGEAMAFQWFDPLNLPAVDQWGFRQDEVVRSCCAVVFG
jgi:ADP-ribose pyrophosphatase YjhB (NUDIX family)